MKLTTTRGYDFNLVTSAMQKAIRRADIEKAGYFALELFHSGFYKYVWKRLYTVSAEDCSDFITQEIEALHKGFLLVNEGVSDKSKGRIFISKAVIVLCVCRKSRDADHLQNFIYDKKIRNSDEEVERYMDDVRLTEQPIPDYAYDVHTAPGKRAGKTKAQFFKSEYDAITPRGPELLENLI